MGSNINNVIKDYFSLDKLNQNESIESNLFYYSLFEPQVFDDEYEYSYDIPDQTEIENEINSDFIKVCSKKYKKDMELNGNKLGQETMRNLFGMDRISNSLLGNRLKFCGLREIFLEYKYGHGEPLDIFDKDKEVGIQVKRAVSLKSFRDNMDDTFARERGLANSGLKQLLLLFIAPCRLKDQAVMCRRVSEGYKGVIDKAKVNQEIPEKFHTLVVPFYEDESLVEFSGEVYSFINSKL